MGIEFARTHIIGRAKGHTAIKAAAYRSGSKLFDERIGLSSDYSHRAADVAHSDILLPTGAPDILRDRETLWLAIETAEDRSTRRATAQLAKDHILALPRELSLDQQIQLATDFAHSQFVAHGVAVDLNVHLHSEGNPHAHLMTTTRTIDAHGIGKKARHLNGGFYAGQRLPEAEQLRHRWADFQNTWAQTHGVDLVVTNNNGEWLAELHRGPSAHMDAAAEVAVQEEGPAPEAVGQTERGQATDRRKSQRAQTIFDDPRLLVDRVSHKKAFFTHHDLWRELFKHVGDSEDFQAIKAKLEQSDYLVPLPLDVADHRDRAVGPAQPLFTSRQVLDDELQLRGTAIKLHAADERHGQIDAEARSVLGRDFAFLSAEQHQAVEHLTDARRVSVVVGLAGAGKSTLLDAARAVWEGAGYRVRGLAPSGKAAEGLGESAHLDSCTIHRFFYQLKTGQAEIRAHDVYVIDEAGMVSTALMRQVVQAVEAAGAKVVLVGDPEQLQPIQAGNPLRTIASKIGYSEISVIRRQRDAWQQQATRDLARGDVAHALAAYDQHGRVQSHADRAASLQALSAAVADGYHTGRSQLALAHARQDVNALNAQIRQQLKARGRLGEECAFDAKAVDRSGFEAAGALPDLDRPTEPDKTLRFARGDRLVFLKNDRQLEVKNGTMGTVIEAGFNALTVRTDEGREVSFSVGDYAEVAHGYAVTVHKSQGVTVDDTHVLINRSWNKHLAYVAMSRHREHLTIYSAASSFPDGDAAQVLALADRQESVIDFAESYGLELQADGRHFEQTSSAELEAKAQAARALLGEETERRRAELQAPLEAERAELHRAVTAASTNLAAHERTTRPRGLFSGRAGKAWDLLREQLKQTLTACQRALYAFDRTRQRARLDLQFQRTARAEVERRHPQALKDLNAWKAREQEKRAEKRGQERAQDRSAGPKR